MKNIKVAIHQPHYFPWLGYFNKMARVEKFVILDEVQLTDKSNMFRNLFLSKTGVAKYLTIPFEKKGYMEKKCCDLMINQSIEWQENHRNFIKDNYRKAPFFLEVWDKISFVFEKKYEYLYEVVMDSLIVIKELLEINTQIVYQSELEHDLNLKKNDLVLALSIATSADIYLSGNGAKKYMEDSIFKQAGIEVVYQQFTQPIYKQINSVEYVPNLSALDLLFNCGIEKSKEIFWQNLNSVNEFGV